MPLIVLGQAGLETCVLRELPSQQVSSGPVIYKVRPICSKLFWQQHKTRKLRAVLPNTQKPKSMYTYGDYVMQKNRLENIE